MPDAVETSSNTTKKPIHPAYAVSNINSKIRTLDGKKIPYSSWVRLFKIHLRAFKLLSHVEGTKEPPKPNDPDIEEWLELDSLIIQWIYSTISDELLARIIDKEGTARETWVAVQAIFINNKHARAATLEQRFTNTKLTAASSFEEYCQTLKDIASQLGDVDQPVSETRLVIQLVRGLPTEYDTIGTIINQSKPSWDDARSMIEEEQQRQAARGNPTKETVLAAPQTTTQTDRQPYNNNSTRSPYANGYKGRNYDPAKAARGKGPPPPRDTREPHHRPPTHHRGIGGQWPPHTYSGPQHHLGTNTSYRPPPWTIPPTPYPSQPFTGYSRPPHSAHVTTHAPGYIPESYGPFGNDAMNPSDIGAAMASLNLNYHDPQWYMDTGASQHITSDQGKISSPVLFPTAPILVGNGQFLKVNGSGNGLLTLPHKTYTLNKIVHSPNVIKDLLSVRKFTTDNNVKLEFDPFGFTVKDMDGNHLSRHNSSGDLYPFTKPEVALLSTSTIPWHDRLGHPGAATLEHLSRFFISNCNKTHKSTFCSSCQLSNSKRLPFSDSNSFTLHCFDIIHCDLWTSPIESNSGYKYYMILVDNHTNYVWIYPLKFKSETYPTFVKFHKLIHTQFQKTIQTFQCDLGGEFKNTNFQNFANQNGLTLRPPTNSSPTNSSPANRLTITFAFSVARAKLTFPPPNPTNSPPDPSLASS